MPNRKNVKAGSWKASVTKMRKCSVNDTSSDIQRPKLVSVRVQQSCQRGKRVLACSVTEAGVSLSSTESNGSRQRGKRVLACSVTEAGVSPSSTESSAR